MSKKRWDKTEMSTLVFAQNTLKNDIAPLGSAENVKARIRLAARRLGWSFTRTKDVWYADPRVSIAGEELRAIEQVSGVTYGRSEARSVDDLIARAEALLDGNDADFHRPFVAALRAFVGAIYRT
jgi:hypothetical protein